MKDKYEIVRSCLISTFVFPKNNTYADLHILAGAHFLRKINAIDNMDGYDFKYQLFSKRETVVSVIIDVTVQPTTNLEPNLIDFAKVILLTLLCCFVYLMVQRPE